MKILVTNVEQFEGKKDGRKWTKVEGVANSGKVVMTLLPSEKVPVGVANAMLTADDMIGIFGEYKTVNIEFDERGRVASIEV